MTDSTIIPFPRLPPPPDDPGEYLTSFAADMPDCNIDKDGNLTFRLRVHPEDKYKGMPLTDIRGRRFQVVVYAPRGRRPLVASNSELAVYGAEARAQTRRRNRRWDRVRPAFEGESE